MSVVVIRHDLDSVIRNSYMLSVLYHVIIFEQVFHTNIKNGEFVSTGNNYLHLHCLLPSPVKVM